MRRFLFMNSQGGSLAAAAALATAAGLGGGAELGCSGSTASPPVNGQPDASMGGSGNGNGSGTSSGGGGSQNSGNGGLSGNGGGGSGGGIGSTCSAGLACSQVICDGGTADGGGVTTTLSGTVYDPAGKVPLYNVVVYIPNAPVQPIVDNGATCDMCGGTVSGAPLVITLTDAAGHFVLNNVPAGPNIPLVMQIGKWRRQVMIPSVAACTDNTLTDHDLTRLPRNQMEGDIPRMALATGGIDPLECLLRKIGIDDSEFSTAGGTGRVHLYTGAGYQSTDDGGLVSHPAASRFASTLNAGAAFADATPFWTSVDSLKNYDILLLACEGTLNAASKSPVEAGAPDPTASLYAFENAGGRVFASHWHRYWFSNGPAPVPSVAAWKDRYDPAPMGQTASGTVNTSFPKGAALRDWLVNVGASTTPGILPIKDSKSNVDSVNPNLAQDWIDLQNPNACYPMSCTQSVVEYMTFNTPIGVSPDQQCGRVVYSDLHVSSGDMPGQPFPSGCVTTDLSPQEKALEFMLFDLSSCIQKDTQPPRPPPR